MKIAKKNGIYIEDCHKMKPSRMSEASYSEAMKSMIVLCTDAIIIDKKKQLFYLARRTVKPMKGYWSIGGRRYAGESAKKSVVRNFLRETSIAPNPDRFNFVFYIDAIWKDRKEAPTHFGKHDLIQVFTIELTPKELAKAADNLCLKEYIKGSLTAFDRKLLVKRKIHNALIDIYDQVFPSTKDC